MPILAGLVLICGLLLLFSPVTVLGIILVFAAISLAGD